MADTRRPACSVATLPLMKPGTRVRAAALAIVIHTPAAVPTNIAAAAEDMSSRVDIVAETVRVVVANIAAGEGLTAVAGEHLMAAVAVEPMLAEATDMGTKRRRQQETQMVQALPRNRENMAVAIASRAFCAMLLIALGSAPIAFAQEAGQRTFNSVTAATDAFAAAVRNHDESAMLAILGPSAKDLISSGDPVADRNKQDTFSLNYIGLHQFAAASDGRTFLYIGPNNWPTPIPLQKNASSQWYFDSDYGRQEILYRRIGANELNVIKVCGAIVEAQRDYYNAFHDGASVHQYAQRFRSSPGTQDGLYWDVKPGAQPPESPLGPLVAQAAAEGYQHHTSDEPHPFHGYVYRLLTSQGPNAPGGATNYIIDGKMTGGFALVAYPVKYRDSGVMTFIVNQDGQVYQKDLGPDTAQIATDMVAYDPDASWQPTNKATVTAQTK